MYDRLKDVFRRGYTPSILAVAAEIRLYAEIRQNADHDRQVAAILRRNGYYPPCPDNRTGFVPGRSVEEKQAYQMISRMIDVFENGGVVDHALNPAQNPAPLKI